MGSVFGNGRTLSQILGSYISLPFPAMGCDLPPLQSHLPALLKAEALGEEGEGSAPPFPHHGAAPGQGVLRGPSSFLCHPSVCPKPSGIVWRPLLELLACGMGGVSGGEQGMGTRMRRT